MQWNPSVSATFAARKFSNLSNRPKPQPIRFGNRYDSFQSYGRSNYVEVTVGRGKNAKTILCKPNSPFGNPRGNESWLQVANNVHKMLTAYQKSEKTAHSLEIPARELARDAEEIHSPKNLLLGCNLKEAIMFDVPALMAGPNFRALYIPEEHCIFAIKRYHADSPSEGVKVFLNDQNDPVRIEIKDLNCNPFLNIHDYFAALVRNWTYGLQNPVPKMEPQEEQGVLCLSPGRMYESVADSVRQVREQLKSYEAFKAKPFRAKISAKDLGRSKAYEPTPEDVLIGIFGDFNLKDAIEQKQPVLSESQGFRFLYIPEEHCIFTGRVRDSEHYKTQPGDGVKVYLDQKTNLPTRLETKRFDPLLINSPFRDVSSALQTAYERAYFKSTLPKKHQ
jgi:hypothetical protein